MVRLAAFAISALLAAGCNTPPPDPGLSSSDALDLTQPLDLFTSERPTVASIRWEEQVDREARVGYFGSNPEGWLREFEVTYHGIQLVYDEFARPTKAFVFRTAEMVPSPKGAEGEFEKRVFEVHFETTDGRLLGVVDLATRVHAFQDPDFRHPYVFRSLLFMAFKFLGEGRGREVALWGTNGSLHWARFEPYQGERPLPGDCQMWVLRSRLEDKPGASSLVAGSFETVACLPQGSLVPIWIVSGEKGHQDRLRLLSEPLAMPALEGSVRLPIVYDLQPWAPSEAVLPGIVPLLVPPRGASGTWAHEVGDRATALQASPGYAIQTRDGGERFVRLAWIGTGIPSVGLLGLVRVPLGLPTFDQGSLFSVTDGDEGFFARVHTRPGTAEQPDLHWGDPQMTPYDEFEPQGKVAELPALVTDAELQGQFDAFIPDDWDALSFSSTVLNGKAFVNWSVAAECEPGIGGLKVTIDARRGFAQRLDVDATDCSDVPTDPVQASRPPSQPFDEDKWMFPA